MTESDRALPSGVDLSEAVALYLKKYPGRNASELDSKYGRVHAEAVRAQIREILDEAMCVKPNLEVLDLSAAGDFVESVMQERHPELSAQALAAIGNYYTYLMA